ncbi:Cystinosin-like protein [Cladobotryum mycophilum]|uniref:Cystinosin-like protein n=1 Tax=Cladobotryum mycophilum TaxID=491253 RepID=A0ABR0SM57_9HYPO
MDGFLRFLSGLFGWIYFIWWSASFYPQPLLNYDRKSTTGTTVDFPLINCLGYLAYSISNIAFYYSPLIRSQYAARYHNTTPTVQFNDVTFAVHALILSIITASQYFLSSAWSFGPNPGNKPSRFILGIFGGGILGVLTTLLIVGTTPSGDPSIDWCELDVIYAIGYVKVVVTLVKYTPQILANRRNKSTQGWSIWQILLDVGGGILSLSQLGIDSYLLRDWSGITGNPIKLAIGNASLVFDSIFMVQHYILYNKKSVSDPESEALLEEDRQHLD